MFGDRSARSTGGWFEDEDEGRSHTALHLPVVRDLRRRVDGIRSILDLGCGIGIYGEMIRTRGFIPKEISLIGVDGYAPYLRNPRVRAYYGSAILGDVFDVVEGKLKVPTDCVLCMDVVEHFERPRALRLLDWLRGRRLAYISTPLFWYRQTGDEWGNVLERHRCSFTGAELEGLGWVPVERAEIYYHKEVGAFRNVL